MPMGTQVNSYSTASNWPSRKLDLQHLCSPPREKKKHQPSDGLAHARERPSRAMPRSREKGVSRPRSEDKDAQREKREVARSLVGP